MAISLFGCKKNEVIDDPPVCGGTVDNSDYDAPKEIKSKDLVELNTSFYIELWETLDDNHSGFYNFKIKDGVLYEEQSLNISTAVSEEVIKKVVEIIDENKLSEINGYDKHTAGLPPEYQPCYFTAVYKSGEKLYFSENNNPQADWAKQLFSLFRQVFIEAGHEELKPSEEALTITRFQFEFSDGDKGYSYFPIKTEDGSEKLLRLVCNIDGSGDLEEKYADYPDNFYKDLVKVVDECNLVRFHTGDMAFANDDCPHNEDGYFEIYIDFANAKQIYGFTNKKEIVDDFSKEIKKIRSFLDPIFD